MLPDGQKGNKKAFVQIIETVSNNLSPGQVLSEDEIVKLTNLISTFFDSNNSVVDFFINNFSEKAHEVQCSSCMRPSIVGARYKCLVCSEFNLCSSCEAQTDH